MMAFQAAAEAHRAALQALYRPDPLQYTGRVPPTSPTTWQLIGQLSTIGLSFVFALVLGFGAGYWLDKQFGSSPWLAFLGFFLGLAAGILNVYRVMQLASKKP